MKIKFALYLSLMLGVTALPAMADDIPYPDPGTVATTDSFVASSTGNITGYFYGSSAADDDKVQVCNVTQGTCSSFALDNHSSAVGSPHNFGAANAGDVLIFNLENLTTGNTFSSNPSLSPDGLNHAYGTPYTGGFAGIPVGTFVGMEDLLRNAPSDLDYNDDEFVFTNVSIVSTPEPSTIFLLGAGLVGVLGIKRRLVAA